MNSSIYITTSNKGPWTEQEDKKLIELVEKFGAEKWAYISMGSNVEKDGLII